VATRAFYCVGTHWDREWYEPFQEFRMWLVELIDALMDLMERDPAYTCFHLDGQAVVLKDYLEVRPERRERFVGMLRERRLVAGPWYVLPDEWLVSGESYVRNIMIGMKTCRELGVEPMNFAYTPDQFGHIAALPMIMRGFDLPAGICWRGTQDEHFPAQFVWIGPDGSRMPTHKLLDRGSYSPFGMLARDPLKRDGLTDEAFKEHFEPLFNDERDRAKTPLVLLLDAIDHQGPDPKMPGILAELARRYSDVDFVWCTLEDYGREMAAHAEAMPEYRGELREPCRAVGRGGQYLIVHTISSRYTIKRRNDQCQAVLEKWAEPMALFQAMAGGGPITRYLDLAWDYLIKNHPHDSICGCSIDQVHRDMLYRFDQSELIADGVVRRAMAHTGHAAATDEALSNIVVYNPLPFTRHGVFEIDLPFPGQWPKTFVDGLASGERVNKFVLRKKNGDTVPFQIAQIDRGVVQKRLCPNGRKQTSGGDIYRLAVELDLPSAGFTGLSVQPTDDATRNFGSLMTGPLNASNGILDVALSPDGTASLTHRASGRTYSRLFLYDDSGDTGDGWTRGQLVKDIVFRSPGTRVRTAIDEDGPLRTVFRAEREFGLPCMADRRTGRRVDERTSVRVTDLIYIEKGASYLRVRTRVENTAMDHRFRVLFPTDLDASTSFAETPFAVVERDIDVADETKIWHERVNPEKAFSNFFGVASEEGGLAILAPFGLHEYEVLQTPDRSLALTLFRATVRTVGTDGEPDGELLGARDFEYAIMPFAGAFDAAVALRAVAALQTGVRTHASAQLPDDTSFVRLRDNAAVVTAIKLAADGHGGVIRLWNPCTKSVTDEIALSRPARSAELCNLNEEPREVLEVDAHGRIAIAVPAHGLATIRFGWK